MPRLTKQLTEIEIKKAKPAEKSYKMFDGGGLHLIVNPNGSKLWRLKYRFDGKENLMSLGAYPKDGLAKVRKERERIKSLIADGVYPAQDRKAQKRNNNTSNHFEALARDWHIKQTARWTNKHSKQVIESLEVDVFPKIGHSNPKFIQPGEVLDVIRAIETRGAKEIANRVLQRINSVFIYGIAIGWCELNPAQNLNKALDNRVKNELSYMPFKDVWPFLKKLSESKTEPQNILAMNLLVHTFLRPGELREGRWSEIDFDQCMWRVPGERMKMGVEHLVPLTEQSIELLNQLWPLSGRCELMFPNRSNTLKPISENTLNNMIKRFGFTGTSHGFRKTASTWLNEHGFKSDAVERQLAHGERDKVRAAYNKANFLDERKRMMQAWSDAVCGQTSDQTNVINIKELAV